MVDGGLFFSYSLTGNGRYVFEYLYPKNRFDKSLTTIAQPVRVVDLRVKIISVTSISTAFAAADLLSLFCASLLGIRLRHQSRLILNRRLCLRRSHSSDPFSPAPTHRYSSRTHTKVNSSQWTHKISNAGSPTLPSRFVHSIQPSCPTLALCPINPF